jgi:hypothetical protein
MDQSTQPPISNRKLLGLSLVGLQNPKNVKAKTMRLVSRQIRNDPDYISKHGSAGAIFRWIQDNNMNMIRKIYPSDLDSMLQNDKQIGLTLAIESGNIDIIRLLLQHGANTNLVDDVYDIPPLLLACKINRFKNNQERYPSKIKLDIIRILLENGANVNMEYKSNIPLLALCSSDLISVDMLKALIEAGADITLGIRWSGENCLHKLAKKQNEGLIMYILDILATRPEIKAELINQRDSSRKTPLHYAVKTGNLEIVKLLVENGSEINPINYHSKTPMAYLINTEKATTDLYPIYQYLNEKGAVNTYTFGGSRTRRQRRKQKRTRRQKRV